MGSSICEADHPVSSPCRMDLNFDVKISPTSVFGIVEYASKDMFPVQGESGKIYVATDTNSMYRWNGVEYVELNPLPSGGTAGRFLKDAGDGQAWDTVGVHIDCDQYGLKWSLANSSDSQIISGDFFDKVNEALNSHRPLYISATIEDMRGTIVMTEHFSAKLKELMPGQIVCGFLYNPHLSTGIFVAIMVLFQEHSAVIPLIYPLEGMDGESAGFGTVTATVDDLSGTPMVQVTSSGPDTAKDFTFRFSGLKGEPGSPGSPGEPGSPGSPGEPAGFGIIDATVDDTVGTPSVNVMTSGTNSAMDISFEFSGLKGQPGAKGEPGQPGANGASAFMPLTETAETTVSITANSAVRVTGQPTALDITLGAPATGQDNEWRLVFKAGEGFALTDTAPDGYALHWEAEPVWQAGMVYEISYGNVGLPDADGNMIIGVLWRAWA